MTLNQIEEQYQKFYEKAMDIKNKVMYTDMRKESIIATVESNEKGIKITHNIGKKVESIQYNDFGQIIKHGILICPYDKQPVSDKDIKALNEALKYYAKAIEIYPKRGSPYKWIGKIYQYLSLYHKAIELYKKAIEFHPAFKNELNEAIKDCEQLKEGKDPYFIEVEKEEDFGEDEDSDQLHQNFKYIDLTEFNKLLSSANEFKKNGKLRESTEIFESIHNLLEKTHEELEKDESHSDKEFYFVTNNIINIRIQLAELYYTLSYKLKEIEDLLYHPAFDGGNQDAYYWLLKLYEKNNNINDLVMCLNSIKKLSKDYTISKKLSDLIKDIKTKLSKEQIKKANTILKDKIVVEFDEPIDEDDTQTVSVYRGGIDIVNSSSTPFYSESKNKMYLLAVGDTGDNDGESKIYLLANRKQIVWEKSFNCPIDQVYVSNSGNSVVIVDSEEKPEFTKEELEEGWENEGLNPNKLLIFDKSGNKIMNFRARNSLIVTADIEPEGDIIACATAFPENLIYIFTAKKGKIIKKIPNPTSTVVDKIEFDEENKIIKFKEYNGILFEEKY